MKFFVQVRMSYIQEVEVEADTKEDAEIKAFEGFDLTKAYMGDGDCWSYPKEDGQTYDSFGVSTTLSTP
jgi:hypothetical protein